MTKNRRGPRRWVSPNRRNRTRSQHWWSQRNYALTEPCVGAPRGCDAAVGEVCVAADGIELVNQPAHPARLERAEAAHPSQLPIPTPEESST